MIRLATALAVAGAASSGLGTLKVEAKPASPSSITIGVDHSDPANQDPVHGRLFEYTDFFTRSVKVHQGEVIDFQTAPQSFHVVALAKNEAAARAAYPVLFNDDTKTPLGFPKVGFGPSNFPVTGGSTSGGGNVNFMSPFGPPDCGVPALSQPNCSFSGGNDVEIAGANPSSNLPDPSQPSDWNITINAAPGKYAYFCFIHPGMRGTLWVVGNNQSATTQSQVDKASVDQFNDDRAAALDAEKDANVVRFTSNDDGQRTLHVKVGVSAADNHVAIDEMFPNPQTVKGGLPVLHRGDKIAYKWPDEHNIHSVFFPAMPPNFTNDTGPIGFDCDAAGYQPFGNGPPASPCAADADSGPQIPFPGVELIADPGLSANLLINPGTTLDSGVLAGEDYGLHPSLQKWSVKTNSSTSGGQYLFHCTVHDFMVSGFVVA